MIVLDTHALIWLVQGDRKLGPEARQSIIREAADLEVLIPAIVIWETTLIATRGQVDLGMDVRRWVDAVLETPAYRLAPLDPEVAIRAVTLPWQHKDAADRMIVATAQHRQAPLVTADETIMRYAAAGHLQAIDARR